MKTSKPAMTGEKPAAATGEKPAATGKNPAAQWLRRNAALVGPAVALLLMLILQFIVISGNSRGIGEAFSSLGKSWMNILRNNAYTGVIALGMCFVIVSGGIDLSVGSQTCAVGAILMFLLDATGPLAALGITGPLAYVIAIVLALLAGLVLGELNGALVSFGRIPPFIVTLGTMKIFRSVTQQLTRHFNPTVPTGFKQIVSFRIGNQVVLPIFYWIALLIITHILFRRTVFGKRVVAVGSNEQAARYSGIRTDAVKRRVYALCGVLCAAAAILYVGRIGSMDFANAGSGYEMDAIAAVVVGGTAMSGGRGSILGAFLGALIVGVMNNILNMLGVPTFLNEAVRGGIIILAVLVQSRNTFRRLRKPLKERRAKPEATRP